MFCAEGLTAAAASHTGRESEKDNLLIDTLFINCRFLNVPAKAGRQQNSPEKKSLQKIHFPIKPSHPLAGDPSPQGAKSHPGFRFRLPAQPKGDPDPRTPSSR